MLRGENNVHGLRNSDLRRRLPLNADQVSRLLKRLRVHGLTKCVGRTYKYYVTALGRRALLAGLQIRETLLLLPEQVCLGEPYQQMAQVAVTGLEAIDYLL